MTQSGEPSPTQRDAVLDGLMKSLDSPARAANKALVRWLVSTDPPLGDEELRELVEASEQFRSRQP